MRKPLFALLASTFLTAAAAQSDGWHFMLKPPKKDALVFFDAATLSRQAGKVVIVFKHVQREQPLSDGSHAVALKESFNCAARTAQILAISTYGQHGELRDADTTPDKVEAVQTDTLEEMKLDMVCTPDFLSGRPNAKYLPVASDLFTFRDHYYQDPSAPK
jgi:hypothetical protein